MVPSSRPRGRQDGSASVPVAETYVQVARGMRFEHRMLQLDDLAPCTIVVRWLPERHLTHVSTGSFLDGWEALSSRNPGLAVEGALDLLDVTARRSGEVRVRLSDPRIADAGLRWTVDVVHGALPSRSGACVLTIGSRDDA